MFRLIHFAAETTLVSKLRPNIKGKTVEMTQEEEKDDQEISEKENLEKKPEPQKYEEEKSKRKKKLGEVALSKRKIFATCLKVPNPV